MEELLDIVDKNDNVVGRAQRGFIHASRLWHRGIHIILFDGKGEIILQKRSMSKDKSPGKYDLSVSGHVGSGEDYDDVAKRRLFEELGLKTPLKRVAKMRFSYGPLDNMISLLYTGRAEDAVTKDEKEIESLVFASPKDLKNMLSERPEKFAKWAREILKWYFGMPSEAEIMEVY